MPKVGEKALHIAYIPFAKICSCTSRTMSILVSIFSIGAKGSLSELYHTGLSGTQDLSG